MSPGVPISSPAARSVELLWSGRMRTALVALFLLFGGISKVMKVSAVLAASVRRGLSQDLMIATGVTLLLSTIRYVIPRTSILGAILLTDYLGGAVSFGASEIRSLAKRRSRFVLAWWCGLDGISAKPACALVPLRS